MNTYKNTIHIIKRLTRLATCTAMTSVIFFSPYLYADDGNTNMPANENTCDLNTNQSYKVDDLISSNDTDNQPQDNKQDNIQTDQGLDVHNEQVVFPEVPELDKSDHTPAVAPWPLDYTINAHIITSAGNIHCKLFAGAHPLTVLNFISLATGKPGWTDASGQIHHTPYYQQLKFSNRVKGAYVLSGIRPEGTGFVIQDERCKTHEPVAGTIAMNQTHPGTASAQFMLMPRNNPHFKNMYPVFGICAPIETINKLTREDAILERIDIEDE